MLGVGPRAFTNTGQVLCHGAIPELMKSSYKLDNSPHPTPPPSKKRKEKRKQSHFIVIILLYLPLSWLSSVLCVHGYRRLCIRAMCCVEPGTLLPISCTPSA